MLQFHNGILALNENLSLWRMPLLINVYHDFYYNEKFLIRLWGLQFVHKFWKYSTKKIMFFLLRLEKP